MSSPSVDFNKLNEYLLNHIYRLIVDFVPGGKQRGREYIAGSIHGGDGSSFSINLDTGKWADFANPDHRGTGLISLYSTINNLSVVESAKKLCEIVGYTPQYDNRKIKLPGNVHPKFGKATGYWIYKNRQGDATHIAMRFDPSDQKKQFTQWHFNYDENKWIPKTTPKTPLYNLDLIYSEKNKIIVICEGEKAAEAAQKILGNNNYISTCWIGGSSAVKKVDLSPLFERDVLLWPDADEPGYKCMDFIVKEIATLAKSIKIINVKPDDAKGMDAADLLGIPVSEAKIWLKNRVKQLKPFSGELEGDQNNQNLGVIPLKAEVISDQPKPSSSSVPTINVQIADTQVAIYDRARMVHLWESTNLQMNASNTPFETEFNILQILRKDPIFKDKFFFDTFYNRYYSVFETVEPMELDDVVTVKIKIYLQSYYGLNKVTTSAIKSALALYLTSQPKKNTMIHKYAEKIWDKTPRIDRFFHEIYGAPDTEYTTAVSRIFWLSLIKRACKPGVKVDTVVILEGAQGIRKSTSLELIAGKQYGVAGRDIHNKDFYLKMSGKILMEIAELNSFSKHDHNELKEMVSTATDEFRIPYGARVDSYPRTCIFVGTTNERNYLKDDTGARRYLPVDCQKVEWDILKENLDQYYAEAYQRGIINDENHWEYPVDMHQLITEKRDADDKEIDSWHEILSDFVFNVEKVAAQDLCTVLSIPIHMQNASVFRRLGRIMKKHGFERSNYRDKNNSTKVRKCYKKIDMTGCIYEWSSDKILKQNDFTSYLVNQTDKRSSYYNG